MFKSILKIFKPNKPAPQLSEDITIDPSTPDEFIRTGFNNVFKNIVVSDQTKKRIYLCYRNAHKEGSPRAEGKCLTEALEGSDWSWPLFDKWEQSFAKRNLFPLSWRSYREAQCPNSQPPTTLEDALPYFTGKQMKAILSKKKVKGRSKATTVKDLSNMILNNCTLRDLNLQLFSKLENIDSYNRSKTEKEKIKLLCGYIGATIYSIRDSHYRETLPPIFKFTAKSIQECPVELKFAKAYNQGKFKKVPPLFPGDGTYITSSRLRS